MTSVRRSLAINTFTYIGSFILTLCSTVIVSRLLTPAEIGVFSVAVSLVALGHVFRDFGIGQYLVQETTINRDKMRAAFTVMVTISWFIAFLLFVLRFPLSDFYGNPGIARVLTALAINFLILPFGAPLLSVLRREMQFGRIAFVNLGSQTVMATTTVTLAFNDFSYMCMAWGSVAGNVTTVLLLSFLRPADAFILPKFSALGDVFRFGAKASTATLASEIGSTAPDLILGRTLGFSEVAFYSRAAGLVTLITSNLVGIVRSVYFPSFAKSFRAGGDMASIFARATAHLVGIIVPLFAIMALVAAPLIAFLFGDQWTRSAPLASLLCGYALITAPFTLAADSLIASGKIGLYMRCQLVVQGVRVLAMLTSLVMPLEHVVLALGFASVIQALIYSKALKISLNLSTRTLLREIWPSYALIPFALFGPALVLAGNHFAGSPLTNFLLLAASGLSALPGWLLGLWVFGHPLLLEINAPLQRYLLNRK